MRHVSRTLLSSDCMYILEVDDLGLQIISII